MRGLGLSRRFALLLSVFFLACSKAPQTEGKAYGVIIDGDDEPDTQWTHAENVDEGAIFMRDYYGVDAKNLTILSVHRGQRPSRENILETARSLALALKPDDLLVVYTTGHGDLEDRREGPDVALPEGDYINGRELAEAFTKNAAGEIVYLGDQCHSGGVLEAVVAAARRGGKRFTAVSSTSAESETFCQTFILPFFDAVYDHKNDADHDGFVSEKEAFAVAKRAHLKEFRADPEMADAQFRRSP